MTLEKKTMSCCLGNSAYSLWTNDTNHSDNWDLTENEVTTRASVLFIAGGSGKFKLHRRLQKWVTPDGVYCIPN